MHVFTHRDHPARVASITPKGDGKSFVVQHTSAEGKVRTKTFANGYLAALRFLLNTEGYVIRGPQDGPVRWMERIRHDYHGELHHAVGPDGGVWFVDPVGHIRRVSPDSLDRLGAPLGAPYGLRASIACAPSGVTWIAMPEWRAGEGGARGQLPGPPRDARPELARRPGGRGPASRRVHGDGLGGRRRLRPRARSPGGRVL
jgi:hypothetical protein